MSITQLRSKRDRMFIDLFNFITSDGVGANPIAINALNNYDVFDFFYLLESQKKKAKKSV